MRIVPSFLTLALCSSVAALASAEPESPKQETRAPAIVVTVEANDKSVQITAKPNKAASRPKKAATTPKVELNEEMDEEELDDAETEEDEEADELESDAEARVEQSDEEPCEIVEKPVDRIPAKKASKKKVRVLRRRASQIELHEPAPPQKRHIWRGMTIAGGIVSGVGALFMGVGVGLYASDPEDSGWFDGLGRAYGIMYMTMGGVISAVGLPMLIVGVTNPGNKGRPKQVEVSFTGTGVQLSGTF